MALGYHSSRNLASPQAYLRRSYAVVVPCNPTGDVAIVLVLVKVTMVPPTRQN